MKSRDDHALIRFVHRTVADCLVAGLDPGAPGETRATMIVACSGGQDSLCLLYALHAVTRTMDNVALHVAHFDHGMRLQEETDADADAVRAHATDLGLPFHHGSMRRPETAGREDHVSEATAREQRYAYLGRLATAIGATYVATGHTATDQAETVLLRLMRGTGIAGLAGMRGRSSWPLGPDGPTVLRPLLPIERATTAAYCRARVLEVRHDRTNDERSYTRNRVRLDLMPQLATFNPRVAGALAALASDAEDMAVMVDAEVDRCEEHVTLVDGRIQVDSALLASLAPPVRSALLMRMLARAGVPAGEVTRDHLRRLKLAPAAGERLVDLPGGHRALVSPARISIPVAQRTAREQPAHPVLGTWTLKNPGVTAMNDWVVQVDRPALPITLDTGPLSAWFAPDALGQPLVVRSRQPGDRIAPFGMSGTKKLQDLLVDAKVPASARNAVPLLVVNSEIAWVVGLRTARWCAVRRGKEAVRITFMPKGDTPTWMSRGRPPVVDGKKGGPLR